MEHERQPVDLNQQGNPHLRKAITVLNDQPGTESRQAFYEAFVRGPILLGVRDVPENVDEGVHGIDEDLELEVLTSEGADGPPIILAFTDVEALDERSPNLPYIAIDPVQLLQWVIEEGYGGIVINPAGPWAGIHRDEVELLLGLKDKKGPNGGLMSDSLDPASAIERALARLLNRVNPGAFVIFREAESEKIIQFTATAAGHLALHLPVAALSRAEVSRAQTQGSAFMRAGGRVPSFPLPAAEGGGYDPAYFEFDFADDAKAALRFALAIFNKVYGRPQKFHLLIEEG